MTETRASGCLLGLACGDALGRPVEFESSDAIARDHGRVTAMLADGTHGQPAGTVTDDTDMALALARSLVAREGFDPAEVTERYRSWYESDPFDVGSLTAAAAGNGSLMRCAPVAMAYDDPDRRAAVAAEESALTHADPRCRESCVALTSVVGRLLRGDDPDAAVRAALDRAVDRDAPAAVREALATATTVDARLATTGYVVDTLETALHDALTAESFESAVVTAVSRGGDADTIGAVTGALAGARFGVDAVPGRWLDSLDVTDDCRRLAADLVALSVRTA